MPIETFRTSSKDSKDSKDLKDLKDLKDTKFVWFLTALTWFASTTAGSCSHSDLQQTLQQLKPATSSLSKGAFEPVSESGKSISTPVGALTSPGGGALSSFSASGSNNPNRPVTDKWALVVGVSKFADPTIPSLRFAAKDAQDFADYLVKKANFAPDHVRVLVNEQATQRQIMSALGDKFLPQVVKKDDLVVVFYSSHGSPASRDVARANFLVAYDTEKNNLFATGIEAASLTRLLRERLHAERILIVMDACHSGGGADGAKDTSNGANFDLKQLPLGAGQMLISSSAEDERSWESKRYPNGIFTHHLLQSMEKNAKSSSISAIFQDMQSSVEDEVRQDDLVSQTPKLRNDMWSGNDLILAVPPSDPHPLPFQVKQWFDSSVMAAKPFSIKPSGNKPAVIKPAVIKPTSAVAQASSTDVKPPATPSAKPAATNSASTSYVNENSAHTTTTTSSSGSLRPSSTPAIVFSTLPGAKPSVSPASYPNSAAASNSGGSQNANDFPNAAGGVPNTSGFPNGGGFPNNAGSFANANGFSNTNGFPNANGFPNGGDFPNASGFPNAGGFPNPSGSSGNSGFPNTLASINNMSGQTFQSDAGGLFTPADGSFTALLSSPNVSEMPGKRVYSSAVGHAKYEVTVLNMIGANQALVGFANGFVKGTTNQGFMHTPGELVNINGHPALKFKFWNLFKKSCVIFCATDNRIITFSATIGARDKNELVFPFLNSISVR